MVHVWIVSYFKPKFVTLYIGIVAKIIKNGYSGNRKRRSFIIANGIIKTAINASNVIQFALMFWGSWSIGLNENNMPKGNKIMRYNNK